MIEKKMLRFPPKLSVIVFLLILCSITWCKNKECVEYDKFNDSLSVWWAPVKSRIDTCFKIEKLDTGFYRLYKMPSFSKEWIVDINRDREVALVRTSNVKKSNTHYAGCPTTILIDTVILNDKLIGMTNEIPFEKLQSVERGFKNCDGIRVIMDGIPMFMQKGNNDFIYWHGNETFDNKSYENMNNLVDSIINKSDLNLEK